MVNFTDLATELVSLIFSAAQRVSGAQDLGPSDARRPPNDSIKRQFRTALSISQVCQRWRDVSLALPELWTSVYLTTRMCQNPELCLQLFARSEAFPLRLQVSLCPPDKRRRPTNIFALISPSTGLLDLPSVLGTDVLDRCIQLRVEGTSANIRSTLHAFANRCASRMLNGEGTLPLEELCVTRQTACATSMNPEPLHLSSISPGIKYLRSSGITFAGFPQGIMEEVVLEDVCLDRANYRALLCSSGVKKLTLRRVTLPTGLDFDDMHLPDFLQWQEHHLNQDMRLEHLELDSIVDYARDNNDRHINFASFYKETLIPACSGTLKTLTLQNLSGLATTAFNRFMAQTEEEFGISFPNVEEVVLHNVPFEAEANFVSNMRVAFPKYRQMKVTKMGKLELLARRWTSCVAL
ncbi:hypothetical protein DFP72DRAFT_1104075 [Ephemerocybe angulata]|uniref:F-box domain-containing protein n=1 Tax=Ephemerocybe angulata TaxID=980116 RepID=A0A8H6I6S8_9AGAR|nr:hypothetical protein DFP72DRAFT_1104075 [Tulosesus angulatus]